MSESPQATLGIIGLGLIGGSFARALKQAGVVKSVAGFDLRSHEVNTALRLGVIDVACNCVSELADRADMIVLATPVRAIESILRELQPCLKSHHIITDVGSVKGAVVATVNRVFGNVLPGFVPGHPIAGSEKSGVAAATPDLFKDHKVILTPLADTATTALDHVARMWRLTGANVLMMSPDHHDEVLAATSHLPHLIAFSLVDTLAGADDNKDIFRYAAGGFRDFTRIAASDPVMWHDIYLSNRQAVLKAVDEFSKDLSQLRQAIESGDGELLLGVFTRAKAAREYFGNMLAGKGYTADLQSSADHCLVEQGQRLAGSIRLCGDRSICHRVIVLGALAKGVTTIEGFLETEASLATLQAFRDMGVVIEGPDRGRVAIHGVGLNGLKPPPGPLYVGHSDTSMRLLSAIMGGQSFSSEIVGDFNQTGQQVPDKNGQQQKSQSLPPQGFQHSHTPLSVIVEKLSLFGAEMRMGEDEGSSLLIEGGRSLAGQNILLDELNAELKTTLLLSAIFSSGTTIITESKQTRDHTERLLAGFNYPLTMDEGGIRLCGRGEMLAQELELPGDFTLAFYFIVAASIQPGSDLLLQHVGMNDGRIRALAILQGMGAQVEVQDYHRIVNEWVADLRIQGSELRGPELQGFAINAEDCIRASEELPALLVAACFARSYSRISDVRCLPATVQKLLRDCIQALMAMGSAIEMLDNEIIIRPHPGNAMDEKTEAPKHPGSALACIILANRLGTSVNLLNCAGLFAFYPQIIPMANKVGFKISTDNNQ